MKKRGKVLLTLASKQNETIGNKPKNLKTPEGERKKTPEFGKISHAHG